MKKDVTINGKRTSKIVEKLGTESELKQKYGDIDIYAWAKEYIEKLNKLEEENNRKVIVRYSQAKRIDKGKQTTFSGAYLFPEKIYYDLKLNKICNTIGKKYKFEYDLNSILSRLVYGRILFPNSKQEII